MIGLMIITHGNLALELRSAMEHMIGDQNDIEIFSITPEDDIDVQKNNIEKKLKELNQGKGVIILTDVFGGTPSNLALNFLEPGVVEIMSGVNLPMLIKICQLRDKDILEVIQEGKNAAQKYISIASEILSENN
ncbi:MAG: PTS fructose transporter subunit IIA [Pseudomonadota bacterium]|nr:PTS fructose transporter subunit IIA [Pseudomonadota bacterium]MEC7958376.1 PTS fructose transporter subunit IIA [Pseudomonadota bacterium]MEC8020097.1 PTS fructose transporter subunit IIA [Pseudomonadota bacterium]MEC8497989.1 PTS fructose transporter subunit IIA [Pseudomonadota bacterium]